MHKNEYPFIPVQPRISIGLILFIHSYRNDDRATHYTTWTRKYSLAQVQERDIAHNYRDGKRTNDPEESGTFLAHA